MANSEINVSQKQLVSRITSNLGKCDVRVLHGYRYIHERYRMEGKDTPVDILTEYLKEAYSKDYSLGLQKRKLQDRLRVLALYGLISIKEEDGMITSFSILPLGLEVMREYAVQNALGEFLKSETPNVK